MQPYLITNFIIKVNEESAGSNSGGGTVNGVNTLAPDNDADSTNELQTLSLNGDTLSISGGNSVVLAQSSNSGSDYYGGLMLDGIENIYNTGFCSDDIPDYFQVTNDTVSNGDMSLNGDHSYCNFTLNTNDTLTIDGNYLILRVADTLTINGVINGSDNSGSTGSGGSSGGLGGSITAQNGIMLNINATGSSSIVNNVVVSSNGSWLTSTIFQDAILSQESLNGARGGSGACTQYSGQCNSSNTGGKGGSGLIIICRILIFNGEILLNGGDGVVGNIPPPNGCYYGNTGRYVGGSGGGGGGSIIINAKMVVSNTGSISNYGGSGGSSPGSQYCSSFGTVTPSSGNPGGSGLILWLGDQ
jgi:hypothetical protein